MQVEPQATREEALRRLAGLIAGTAVDHPTRVAIDGPDAAGKTTLADELGATLRGSGREIIRASADGFHRPRARRHARGPDSPAGYYEDSFDSGALRSSLLDPLGPGGDRFHRTAVFDFRTDDPVDRPWARAAERAVLLVDGVFLLRPELRDAWDVRIFVTVTPDTALRRGIERDGDLFGSAEAVEQRYRDRYLPGQQIYVARCHPEQIADVVVVNDDPARPLLRRP